MHGWRIFKERLHDGHLGGSFLRRQATGCQKCLRQRARQPITLGRLHLDLKLEQLVERGQLGLVSLLQLLQGRHLGRQPVSGRFQRVELLDVLLQLGCKLDPLLLQQLPLLCKLGLQGSSTESQLYL